MTMEILPVIVTGVSPVLVVVVTWLTKRSMEQREAKARDYFAMLENQRNDFSAVIDPLRDSLAETRKELASTREELASTKGDVSAMRSDLASVKLELDRERGDKVEIINGIRHIRSYFIDKYNDHGPRLAPWIEKLIKERAGK